MHIHWYLFLKFPIALLRCVSNIVVDRLPDSDALPGGCDGIVPTVCLILLSNIPAVTDHKECCKLLAAFVLTDLAIVLAWCAHKKVPGFRAKWRPCPPKNSSTNRLATRSHPLDLDRFQKKSKKIQCMKQFPIAEIVFWV